MLSQPLYPNESDLEVPVRDFCFGCSSIHHAAPFSTKEVSFFVFELFQKYSASKDYFGPLKMNIVFVAAPASYCNNNGYCFNQCESKVSHSLCNHIVLLGHRGRQLMT